MYVILTCAAIILGIGSIIYTLWATNRKLAVRQIAGMHIILLLAWVGDSFLVAAIAPEGASTLVPFGLLFGGLLYLVSYLIFTHRISKPSYPKNS